MNSDNHLRYFFSPKNAAKIVPHGNSPRQNSYWLMEELDRYQKGFIHVSTDELPILLEAKVKKAGKAQVERFVFTIIDSAINFISDTGLTRHRLSIVSKKLNMPTIIEVFSHYMGGVMTYTYRLEDETLVKKEYNIGNVDMDESLFCIYSAVNGKPYELTPYE